MQLEGFWVFITIIIVSVVFIFLMTRDGSKNSIDEDQPEQTGE
jgi:hypothetical protein